MKFPYFKMIKNKEKNQGFFCPSIFPKSRQGLSAVVAALMLVLLTLVLVGIVWAAISSLVNKNLPEQGCLDAFGKVTLSNAYTCYNTSTNEMQFSISIEDIEITRAIVSISGQGTSKSVELTNQDTNVSNLRPYNGNYQDPVKLPEKNSGLTYVYNLTAGGFNEMPDSIRIVPVVGTDQCEVSDTIDEVYACGL